MMPSRWNQVRRGGDRPGFTLVELLIVVTIIVILTAVAIPAVLPAITSRRVSEASRILQAQIAAARDLATRANAPRGIRLLPDPAFPGPQGTEMLPLAYNRLVSLEGPPDHKEGFITVLPGMGWNPMGMANFELPALVNAHLQGLNPPFTPASTSRVLVIVEQKYHTITIPGTTPPSQLPVPNPPTNWYGNIRQGDKIYIPALKRYFSIAGPVPSTINGQPNNERFIGIDPSWSWAFPRYNDRVLYPQYPATTLPANVSPAAPFWPPDIARDGVNWSGLPNMRWPEFLIVTNGVDDDGDGTIDEHFDGINNNPLPMPGGDDFTDPAFDGLERGNGIYVDDAMERNLGAGFPLDDLEWENDADLGLSTLADDQLEPGALLGSEYRIIRRPVPAQGSSEVTLPGDVLIDATTVINVYGTAASNSRSRLPIGPFPSYYADFMIAPSGQVLQATASFNQAPPMEFPFLHFWLAERADIMPPYVGADNFLKLPVPKDANYAAEANYPTGTFLTKGRRLLSVFTRTGQVVSNSVETFDVNNSNLPFIAPQRGARETQ